MKFFVQYDVFGNIGSTVCGEEAPDHPRQLEFDEVFETHGLRVDLDTLELVEIGEEDV